MPVRPSVTRRPHSLQAEHPPPSSSLTLLHPEGSPGQSHSATGPWHVLCTHNPPPNIVPAGALHSVLCTDATKGHLSPQCLATLAPGWLLRKPYAHLRYGVTCSHISSPLPYQNVRFTDTKPLPVTLTVVSPGPGAALARHTADKVEQKRR